MRTRQFSLAPELIAEFFQQAEENELDVQLLEVNDEGELEVEINYEDEECETILNLIELVEAFYEDEE